MVLRGVTPGAGLVGMLLPMELAGLPLAVGIGGWAREMRARQQEYLGLLASPLTATCAATSARPPERSTQ